MSQVLEQKRASVQQSLINDINAREVVQTGADELLQEGKNRDIRTRTHTIRARDLCPKQGRTAAAGFVDLFRRG